MLRINGATLMLCDTFPEMGEGKINIPKALGRTALTIHLNVEDADAVFSRAIKAGAKATMPIQDTFWGDRYGQFADSFGLHWSVSTKIRNVSQDETAEATKKYFS